MKEMKDLALMVMQPQEHFLEWVMNLGIYFKNNPSTDTTEMATNLANLTAALIPKQALTHKLNEFLMQHSEKLLTHEWSRWTSNDTLWPLRSDAEMLLDYFRLSFYKNIVDLRNDTSRYDCAAILKPTIKLKNWLKETFISLGDSPHQLEILPLDRYVMNASTYLLPSTVESVSQSVECIMKQYQSIFDYELKRYISDEKYWPSDRDTILFTQWFEIDVHIKIISLTS